MADKKKKKADDAQNAGVRTYRFDAKLWARFEEDCALNLYNPRAVLETLVFDWLSTDDARRKELARKKHEADGKGG
jgi:hypothetical protein